MPQAQTPSPTAWHWILIEAPSGTHMPRVLMPSLTAWDLKGYQVPWKWVKSPIGYCKWQVLFHHPLDKI
jgi:hypothetical protein